MKPIARSGGRSAVAAAAYRTATIMLNERDGLAHDFARKKGVEHAEIVLPVGVEADWALDRSRLWNAVEHAEKRKDARVAREFEIALPHELTSEQRLELTRDFARDLANRYGGAVDFAIHQPHTEGDVRNFHAHVLMTTRTVLPDGLGEKTLIERENKWLLNHDQPTSHMQLRDIRQSWESHANRHLVRAGLDVRIDHRSHQERGLEVEPTEHMGVFASQMDRRGLDVSRTRIDEKAARRNAELIREKPEQVLSILTDEKSVFDRHDVARALHRYIDDSQGFQNAFAAVMASSALVELRPGQNGELARYSTYEMLEIEHAMAASAERLVQSSSHGVNRHHVDQALSLQDKAIRTRTAASLSAKAERGEMLLVDRERLIERSGLSEEQRVAVQHVTGSAQVAAVIGFAGAGKSTMLAAARDAWERQGYRVQGAALAGKAAEGLEESSDIASRTLASWEYGWQSGRGRLGKGDVLVIDEAGMVGSRQLARFVMEAEARGAKLVLVGDHEQLQAIGAGSPFRAIAERVGAVELSEIRRQSEGWQREASIAFATHRTGEALASYADRGAVNFSKNRDEARAVLVRDYLSDLDERRSGSRIALAHRRVDVRAINADIRASLQEQGRLARGEQEQDPHGREVVYQTNDGKRSFAPGDRIVLLENNRDLGVKNGMLGTVEAVELGALQIRLDGAGQNNARAVSIPVKSYQAFDHGYATTIHKSQGATVDCAFVMASGTMDRHLTYVAMTRHRDSVKLYAGRDELKDMKALSASMGRSGAKETTLDYTHAFAERRGLAEEFGVRSEIAVSLSAGRAEDGPAAHDSAMDERVRSQAVRQPSATAEAQRSGHGVEMPGEKVEPLVPALTKHSRSVEEIAREKARPDFERAMEAVRSVGRNVYADLDGVAAKLSVAIVDKGMDGQALAKSVAERPEQLGELRGKSGLLGENKERRAARHYANALSNYVASAGRTWERRLEAERQSETWNREKRDVVEVPGLTQRSEAILKQLDGLSHAEKPKLLEQLSGTPEGKQALEEARQVVQALEQRFGSADPRDLKTDNLRLGPEVSAKLDRIKHVACLTDRAQRAELSRQYELKRSLNKGLGLGM
ncbi:Ti-type conjugative transfer relaxase TraA [Rhizobium herbae]|uniref:Ti-type conjugative transfer relaxase TraA n=2 Tax=Rhizobium herbae TaxID=508661 RepID=A0ABS4EW45_9HYPH|nr:Ti-type conjugative transfer relaxase TraA [Rhizobium herbae]